MEINIKGHPTIFYTVGAVLKNGPVPETDYKEFPMVEVFPIENPNGEKVNIVTLRLFENETEAAGFRDYISGSILSDPEDSKTIDYTVCKEWTDKLYVLKDKMLKNLAEVRSDEEDVANKLCMIICTFQDGKVQEREVLYQNLSNGKSKEMLN